MDQYIGKMLDNRYEILERIGTGGMAIVYKAKCHRLNRLVAIKILKSDLAQNEEFRRRFNAESQAVAQLSHPNIVSVYDVSRGGDMEYIVMELIDGITLKQYMEKRGQLNWRESLHFITQIMRGLSHAHSRGIIHRDIKPQNIIISKEGKVKVTDFGIAKVASSSTINSSSTMGSVHYISPEQARGGYSDERSDIYSLGITIFEMLTGTVPFDGDSTVAVAVQHIQDEIPAPSTVAADIPVSIDKIVLKCTQKKPDRRYQSAAELITDLKKSLVMPDEDFVVMAPMYAASGTAASVTADALNAKEVRAEEEDDILSDDDDMFIEDDDNKEETENNIEESEEDDDVDIDDESNDKLDLIMKIIGIGIAVIILIVTIFVIVKLVGSTRSSKNDNTETTSSIEETISTEAGKNTVTVPKVEGMTKDDAVKALNEVGLGYKQVVQSSKTVAKDTVISQGTKAGAKVAKNTQIILTISGGEDVVNTTVPSVTGETEDDAREKLEAAGFKVTVDYDYSSTVAEGKVIKASPSGSVAKGTTVTITVSRGKQIQNVTMANIVGMTESDASQWLQNNGLSVYTIYDDSKGEYGKVIACKYSEGTSVPEGTTVTITVSHKPEPTTKAPTKPSEATSQPSSDAAQN